MINLVYDQFSEYKGSLLPYGNKEKHIYNYTIIEWMGHTLNNFTRKAFVILHQIQ